MSIIKTYVCLVDQYKRPSRQHNTKGRYYVGAKTEKEAKKILQKVIGFGSIQIYYEATEGGIDPMMGYKEVKKAMWDSNASRFIAVEAKHDTAPQTERDE